jgi:hypothetical protein
MENYPPKDDGKIMMKRGGMGGRRNLQELINSRKNKNKIKINH